MTPNAELGAQRLAKNSPTQIFLHLLEELTPQGIPPILQSGPEITYITLFAPQPIMVTAFPPLLSVLHVTPPTLSLIAKTRLPFVLHPLTPQMLPIIPQFISRPLKIARMFAETKLWALFIRRRAERWALPLLSQISLLLPDLESIMLPPLPTPFVVTNRLLSQIRWPQPPTIYAELLAIRSKAKNVTL